jgi:hypothetical protein
MTPFLNLMRQAWQKLTRRPPPLPPLNDDLVGVAAPHGPRPLSGAAHARPNPHKAR